MLLPIAWRNLWRNRRRTLLSAAAIAGGLASMLALYAMTRGMGDRLLESMTGSYLGHIQIHRLGYREDQQLSLNLPRASALLEVVRRQPGVAAATGRLYGFAHATFVRGTDQQVRQGGGEEVGSPVVALLGVEPEHEPQVTDLEDKLQEGRWLRGDAEAVVGAGLAQRHHLRLGDALLPTSVAASGAMQGPWAVSDEVPRVVGIIRTGVEDIDSRMVLLPLGYVQQLIQLEDRVHEVAIRASDPTQLPTLVARLRHEVARWREAQDTEGTLPSTVPLALRRETTAEDVPAAQAPRGRLVGIAPSEGPQEDQAIARELRGGHFLRQAEEILLSSSLADQLGVSIDDRVTVSVPVECGEQPTESCPPSEESFRVAGIFSAPGELAQVALVAEPVLANNIAALAPTSVASLEPTFRDPLVQLVARWRGEEASRDEILPWNEVAPELAELMKMMDVMPVVFFIILYIAVVLGIVNTMLMATFERTRELGIMRALGMRPEKVVAMVVTESVLLSLVGAGIGLALGLPLLAYWQTHGMNLGVFMEGESFNIAGVNFDPTLWPRMNPSDIVASTLVVIVMTSLAGLWPAIRAARLRPTQALRQE